MKNLTRTASQPAHRPVIKHERTSPDEIEMIDGRGKSIFVSPEATIEDLVLAGVTSFGVVDQKQPRIPHQYRSTGDTHEDHHQP